MAAFAPVLDRTQASAIRDYIIHRANAADAPNAGKPVRQPDLGHGAVIVAQGTAAGAPACAQCHALTGGSDTSGAFPRLAGQPAAYLSRQLRGFRSGARANAIMSPIASALSPDDAADVSAYFASLDAPFPPLAAPDPDLVKKGRELAEAGDPAKGIPALRCMPWRRRHGRAPDDPLPWRTIRALHSISAADVAEGIPQEQPGGDGSDRQQARRSRDCGDRRLLPAGSRLRPAAAQPKRLIPMPSDEAHHSAATLPEHVAAPIGAEKRRKR